MSDLKIDNNYDLVIENNELKLAGGVEGIAQNLKQRLSFFFGEWFLDKSKGIPFIQHIFTKNPNITVIDAAFKKEILETAGIIDLQDFELTVDTENRLLMLKLKARTHEGFLNFNENFIIGG